MKLPPSLQALTFNAGFPSRISEFASIKAFCPDLLLVSVVREEESRLALVRHFFAKWNWRSVPNSDQAVRIVWQDRVHAACPLAWKNLQEEGELFLPDKVFYKIMKISYSGWRPSFVPLADQVLFLMEYDVVPCHSLCKFPGNVT